MRTVPQEAISDTVREISSRGVVRQRLPRFNEEYDSDYFFHDHDVDVISGGFLRAASISGTQNGFPRLFIREVNPEAITPGLVDLGIPLTPLSSVSVYGEYLFYHKENGDVVRRHLNGSEEFYFSHQSDVGLAAVSEMELFAIDALNPTTFRIRLHDGADWVDEFPGAIYGEGFAPSSLDAVRIDGVDYLVWQTADKRNARTLRRTGDVWSESELVLPLDIVDDTFQFRLGGASVIDGRMVLVGTLIRNENVIKIYTIGPDQFTLGREVFIAKGRVAERMISGRAKVMPIGKMLERNNMLYVFGGDNRYHYAKSTILFGADREDLKTEVGITGVTFDSAPSRPARARFTLKPTYSPLVKSGNIFDWYAAINGTEVRVGRFGIDGVIGTQDGQGKDFDVITQSLSLKSMADWESDSSFDYWSQTKQTSRASNIAETIRGPGEWEEDGDSVRYLSMNQPGVLYSIQKATRNGTASGEFRVSSDTSYAAKYGVAIAYHRETPQDAAARLGETFAQNRQAVSHGVFFVVKSDTGESELYWVVNDDWRLIATGSPVVSQDWHWLRIDFREGRIRCHWREDEQWYEVIDHRIQTDDEMPIPWFRDEIGRAALYLENVVPGAKSYGFTSDANFVPVETVNPFPNQGIVKVNSENIRYGSKGPDRSIPTPMGWRDGQSHPGVLTPHNSQSGLGDGYVYTYTPGPFLGRTGSGQELLGGFFMALENWHLRAIDIYLHKINPADAYAEVWIGDDDSDNGHFPPDNTILAKQRRLFKHGAPSNMLAGHGTFFGGDGWVRFNLDVRLRRGEAYVIYVVDRGNIPDDGLFNVVFSRRESVNHNTVRYTGRHTGWFVYPEPMLMRLIGSSPALPGHEVYLDTVGPPQNVDFYNNCILTCVEGRGVGRSFRIAGYDHYAPHQWLPNNPDSPNVGNLAHGQWVDRRWRRVFTHIDPRTGFDETSKLIVVPALNVAERGVDSEAVAHGISSANLLGEHSHNIGRGVEARSFEYCSADKDITIGNMLSEIAKKANVLDVEEDMRISGDYPTEGGFSFVESLLQAIRSETAIVDFEVDDWKSNAGIGLSVFPPGFGVGTPVRAVAVVVYEDEIVFYRSEGEYKTILERFPVSISGRFTISYQKDSFSVWNNGHYLTHFFWSESEAQERSFDRGYSVSIINDGQIDCRIYWSQLDTRVDNYILDIGQSALALSQQLIGEKRIYMLDSQDGGLKLFRERKKVNSENPLDLHVSLSQGKSDSDLRTRLRSEGVEIVERADYEAIAEHGNLFRLIGLREPDNIAETMRELRLVHEDLLKSFKTVALSGVADLRIEPEDLVLNRINDDYRYVRAGSVGLTMRSGESPIFDMDIDGFVWEDANLRRPRFLSVEGTQFTIEKEQKLTIKVDADPAPVISIEGE